MMQDTLPVVVLLVIGGWSFAGRGWLAKPLAVWILAGLTGFFAVSAFADRGRLYANVLYALLSLGAALKSAKASGVLNRSKGTHDGPV
ncbi:MAG: hypothetical protein ACE5G2_07455 [Candidatus Krumholzibacteriia bacterium]